VEHTKGISKVTAVLQVRCRHRCLKTPWNTPPCELHCYFLLFVLESSVLKLASFVGYREMLQQCVTISMSRKRSPSCVRLESGPSAPAQTGVTAWSVREGGFWLLDIPHRLRLDKRCQLYPHSLLTGLLVWAAGHSPMAKTQRQKHEKAVLSHHLSCSHRRWLLRCTNSWTEEEQNSLHSYPRRVTFR